MFNALIWAMGRSCHSIFTLKYPKNGQKTLNTKIYKVVRMINSLFRIFLRIFSIFIKSKGDFYGKQDHELTLTLFLKNVFVISADANF